MNKLFNHPCPNCICISICRNKVKHSVNMLRSLDCKTFNEYRDSVLPKYFSDCTGDHFNKLYYPLLQRNKYE